MGAILNKIAVEVVENETTTSTGIITGDKKKPDTGIVVSKGKNVTDEIKIGDTLIFHEYSGKAVTIEGKDLILLNEGEIFYVKD